MDCLSRLKINSETTEKRLEIDSLVRRGSVVGGMSWGGWAVAENPRDKPMVF